MADNYLEQRMHDLRAGRLSQCASRPVSAPPRKGFIHFSFPSRRVLIVGELTDTTTILSLSYLRSGCKVAVIAADSDKGSKMAHNDGIRFYPAPIDDNLKIVQSFENLLKAWRDIDILICTDINPKILTDLAETWHIHKEKYPIPSDFGGRLISISKIISPSIPQETPQVLPQEKVIACIHAKLSAHKITANTISSALSSDEITSTVLFLSLPASRYIDCKHFG